MTLTSGRPIKYPPDFLYLIPLLISLSSQYIYNLAQKILQISSINRTLRFYASSELSLKLRWTKANFSHHKLAQTSFRMTQLLKQPFTAKSLPGNFSFLKVLISTSFLMCLLCFLMMLFKSLNGQSFEVNFYLWHWALLKKNWNLWERRKNGCFCLQLIGWV